MVDSSFISHGAKVRIIRKELKDVLDNGGPHTVFLNQLIERLIWQLSDDHDNLDQFKTREEVGAAVRREILEDRKNIYYHLCRILTFDLDADLASQVAHMAQCHVAQVEEDDEALERVYDWLYTDITMADRVNMMSTYLKTATYLRHRRQFSRLRNDLRVETVLDYTQLLSDLVWYYRYYRYNPNYTALI